MLLITLMMLVFVAAIFINGRTLHAKNRTYVAQELELEIQVREAQAKSEEIEVLKEEIMTDEYVRKMAGEKLRMINPGEVVFRAAE